MQADFDREEVKLWQTIDETYSIDRNTLLGKGSYGKVYRGYSFQKQCLVAIKIVEKHKSDQNQIATLEVLSSLNHQYVMGYYGYLQKQAQIYLFLQYCPNGTLKQFLMKGLSQLQVLRLFRQLVEGMCYINAKKKMHRDLKPENILIGPQFDIKISDFGLSQQTTSVIMTGQTGTPIYAAPEVYLNLSTNQKYTDNCDVWSAGLILYELLTGQHLLKKVIEHNSLKMLKQQWIEFHKGIRVVNLGEKYHPIWNVFINWLLDFDGKRRPTFLIVLQTIKRIYKQLSGQLQKDIVCFQQPLQRYHSFTEFHIQKYQILVDLCQTFTTRDINIRNEFKYLIMFCCLMRYISFTKTFIRNLTYKRLEFNKKPLIDQQQSKHPYLDLIIKKCQIVLDQRYDFYNQQVKITIIPKILNTYSQRPESQAILMALENVIHMVSAFSKGQSVAAEEKYEEALKSILPVLQRLHGDVTSYLKEDELKVYYQMLIAMNISDRYPTERFYQKDLFSIQKRNIQTYNQSEVKRQINILKEHIF